MEGRGKERIGPDRRGPEWIGEEWKGLSPIDAITMKRSGMERTG
jgi:hypothetical protein